jgi:hypothetical protein
MDCQHNLEIFKLMVANCNSREDANDLCRFRHRYHLRFDAINACAKRRMQNALDVAENRGTLPNLLEQGLQYVHNTLITSFLYERKFHRDVLQWIQKKLFPSSTTLLCHAENLQPIVDTMKQLQHASVSTVTSVW